MTLRPRPKVQTNLIQLRISDQLLKRVDAVGEQAGMSRSEAVRYLLIHGLNAADRSGRSTGES